MKTHRTSSILSTQWHAETSSDYPSRGSLLGNPWMLVLCASTVIILAGWLVSRIPPRYEAMVTIHCSLKDESSGAAIPTQQELRTMVLDRQIVEPALRQAIQLPQNTNWEEVLGKIAPFYAVRATQIDDSSCAIRVGFISREPANAQRIAYYTASSFVNMMKQTDRSRQQAAIVAEKAAELTEAESAWNQAWNELTRLHRHPKLEMLQDVDSKLAEVESLLADRLKLREQMASSTPAPGELPIAPALERTDNRPAGSLAQQTLELYLKKRAEIASVYTEQHPAVASLDRKIRTLAMQVGNTDLTSPDGIRQASFDVAERQQQSEESAAQLEEEIAELQEQRQTLREQCELKIALERQLGEQRAKVESLFAEKNRLQSELSEVEQQLKVLQASNPVDYHLVGTDAITLRYLGPDRRKWFGSIALGTLAMTLACWWWGRGTRS